MYSLTLTDEQKDDILTALSEYRDGISKFDQFSSECERLENLIDLFTRLKPIKEDFLHAVKVRSGALYGKSVYHLLDPCKHCPHFNDETFICDKIHHCDCDCPECSPESYV